MGNCPIILQRHSDCAGGFKGASTPALPTSNLRAQFCHQTSRVAAIRQQQLWTIIYIRSCAWLRARLAVESGEEARGRNEMCSSLIAAAEGARWSRHLQYSRVCSNVWFARFAVGLRYAPASDVDVAVGVDVDTVLSTVPRHWRRSPWHLRARSTLFRPTKPSRRWTRNGSTKSS